jgi:hypothetical protein
MEPQANKYRGLRLCARRTAVGGRDNGTDSQGAFLGRGGDADDGGHGSAHRGFTNEKLFLKLDDGKQMTFVVDIAGDKEPKWQKDFVTLSRITVT